MADADVCCGSAGSYNITQPEYADRLLARKVDAILTTGANAVISANPVACCRSRRDCERMVRASRCSTWSRCSTAPYLERAPPSRHRKRDTRHDRRGRRAAIHPTIDRGRTPAERRRRGRAARRLRVVGGEGDASGSPSPARGRILAPARAPPSATSATSTDHLSAPRDTRDVRDLGGGHLRVRRDRARYGSVCERRGRSLRGLHARDAHRDRKAHDVPAHRRRGRSITTQ